MYSKEKILAIIQPSFFPYHGYFDIIKKSDVFIFYDHVQYDKNGWRNRNRILINGNIKWITIPVKLDQSKIIKNVQIFNPDYNLNKIYKKIKESYKKAKNYKIINSLIEEIFFFKKWIYISEFNIYSTQRICEFLNIKSTFYKSSDFKNIDDKNQNIINHCINMQCNTYLSGLLAKDYISEKLFSLNKINLIWYDYKIKTYSQLHSKDFIPRLSIIDYLYNKEI